MSWRSWLVAALTVPVLGAEPAAAQQPIEPIGAQLRLTQPGDGSDSRRAAVAYDEERDRYLLAYDAINPAVPSERWVFTRLLSGDGTPLGPATPVARADTAAGSDSDEVPSPDVAFSPGADTYLVAFAGISADAVANHHEILTVTLSADGAKVSGPTRISLSGDLADPARDAQRPAIAHDPDPNRFLVAWESDGFATAADEEFEIFDRLVGTDGHAVADVRRISTQGADGDASFDAFSPRVVHVPSVDRYVVVWGGDVGTSGNSQAFARLASATTGAGSTQVTVSEFPASGEQDAFTPDVTYNSAANELLVAFLGEELPLGGLRASEVFVQRLAAADLTELGGDTRVSEVGPPESTGFNADMARVRYNPALDRYLVTWRADGALTGLADNEWELYGQLLGSDAGQIGGDRRISVVGADGDSRADAVEAFDDIFFAQRYGLAANSKRGEWLVAFSADPVTDDAFDIFGRRWGVNPDADGDGSPIGEDCDDTDPAVRPGAFDVPDNGRDEDCAGGDAVNLDRDGDGENRPADCNDGNPFIRHGIADIPGNGIDEDCSGADTPVMLGAKVRIEFLRFARPTFAVITRLRVKRARPGMTVTLSCRGRGCPRGLRRSRTLAVQRAGTLRLDRFLRKARLRPRTVVKVKVLQPGFIGLVERYKVDRTGTPRGRSRCLPPGATRPQRCPE